MTGEMVTNLGVHGNTSMKGYRFPPLSSDKTSDIIKEPAGSFGASQEGLIAAPQTPLG